MEKTLLPKKERNRLISDALILSSQSPEMYYSALGLMEAIQSKECRVLTPEDSGLIQAYLEIFASGLKEIAHLYPQKKIEETQVLYTPEFVKQHLALNRKKRFVGHFTEESLDGILIEGFDEITGVNRTLINWLIARQSGLGVGSALVEDCIQRAKAERKTVVALGVSQQNKRAQKLYEKLGFIPDVTYDEGRMLLMNYFIE